MRNRNQTTREINSTKSETKNNKSEPSNTNSATSIYKTLSKIQIGSTNDFYQSPDEIHQVKDLFYDKTTFMSQVPNIQPTSNIKKLKDVNKKNLSEISFPKSQLMNGHIDRISDSAFNAMTNGEQTAYVKSRVKQKILDLEALAKNEKNPQYLFSDETTFIPLQQPSLKPTQNIEIQKPVNETSFLKPQPTSKNSGSLPDSFFNTMNNQEETDYVKARVRKKILALEKMNPVAEMNGHATKKTNTNDFFNTPLPKRRKIVTLNTVDNNHKPG